MDFNKLTSEELWTFFDLYSVSPIGDPYQYASNLFIRLGSQGRFPEPVIDLYIATQLIGRFEVPKTYNSDMLNGPDFMELTKILNLPSEDTPEIRIRAKRILRILLSHIKIVPMIFKGINQPGDFNWMINHSEYQDVLFIFNDNQEQFTEFLNNPYSGSGCISGGGNAVIRPYQCMNPPKAAGIPTGVHGKGYTDINTAKPYIDAAIDRIKQLIKSGNYKRIMYSAGNDGRSLGTSIFSPSDEIKNYIVHKIEGLA